MSEQTETLPSRVEATYKAREVEGVLDRRHADIQKILEDYGIPLVANAAPSSPQR